MASIRKKPSGKWEVRLHLGDGRYSARTFTSKRDAERYAAHSQVEFERGEWRNPRDGRIPFEEWVTIWWQSKDLRPATEALYRYLLDSHVMPAFKGRPLAAISPDEVAAWKVKLGHSGINPSTANKAFRLLADVMGLAVKRDRIAKSPTYGVEAPKEPKKRPEFFTPEEVHQIAEAIDPHYRVLVLAAAYTGLRWGELVGLRPSKVDLLHRTIRVDEQLTEVIGKHAFGTPISDQSIRTVSIPDTLSPLLEDQIASRARDGLVFPGKNGGPIRRSNFTRRDWHPALRRAGVPALRFHVLRHTAVTIAIGLGFTAEQLTEWIGHSSIRTTYDRYGHMLPKSREDIADRMGAVFEAAKASEPLTAHLRVIR